VQAVRLRKGHCQYCGQVIAGKWEG